MSSEVARFRETQALEEQAAYLGLSGIAVVTSHEAITKRMEIGSDRYFKLLEEGRYEEAQRLLVSSNWC